MLASAPLRSTEIASVGGQKRFYVTRDSQASSFTPLKYTIFSIRYNPDWSEGLTTGVAASASTVEVDATNIILRVDGALDRNIAHAGLSIQQQIDAINATQDGRTNRWRAGLTDTAPNVVHAPEIFGQRPTAFGYLDGLGVHATGFSFVRVSVGSDVGDRGAGNRLPDGFNALYSYPLTPATNPLHVGTGGGVNAGRGEDILPQRRSAFRNSPAALAQEQSPAAARFETVVKRIIADIVVGVNPIRFEIFDGVGTSVWSTLLPAAALMDIVVPDIVVRGRAYVVVDGGGSGITAGVVTVQGLTRRA